MPMDRGRETPGGETHAPTIYVWQIIKNFIYTYILCYGRVACEITILRVAKSMLLYGVGMIISGAEREREYEEPNCPFGTQGIGES